MVADKDSKQFLTREPMHDRKNMFAYIRCGFLIFLAALSLCVPAFAELPVITSAAKVHDLPSAEPSHRVHLIATVTYYEPGEQTLFVEDATGAVYVKTDHPYPLHRGDLVQIDGWTAGSYRTTVALNPTIKVLGHGSFHRIKVSTHQSYEELMAGKFDCRYVIMQGVIRSALVETHGSANVLELEILMPGGMVQGYLQNYRGLDLERLVDATVQVSGVVGGQFNARWQLMRSIIYGADAADLHIVAEPRLKPWNLPLTSVNQVMQTRSVDDHSRRLRVRGAVTFYRPGHSVVLQQNGSSLYVETRQTDPLPLGAVIDVVGFADEGGYGPVLRQAQIYPTGQTVEITPKQVTYAQAIVGTYSDELVALRGRVFSQLHANSSDTLSLMVDDHAVTVVLQEPQDKRWLPDLRRGTLVSVTGICRVTPTGVWATPGMTPMMFRIDLRSRNDLQIIALPSWWTVARLLGLICALLALSLVITSWAMMLRRRVSNQTGRIERTIRLEQERSRLLEAINSESSLDQLLSDICSFAQTLAPGMHCCCTTGGSQDGPSNRPASTCVGQVPGQILFEGSLTDPKGRQIGTFRAGMAESQSLTKYELEVASVATSLANLALNQRRIYEELNYTSTHDQLTALPNRRLSDTSLEAALQEAARHGDRVGVAYIDVDHFKLVNDQHGHKFGDLYLQQIAARLASVVRTHDKLARIGGDEFLLVATALGTLEDAEACRLRLATCFERSFVLDGCRLSGSASIGLAVYPDHGTTAEELKRHADIDMYSAKQRRRAEGDHALPASVETDVFSAKDLEDALAEDRFRLFYQPQFSSGGELRGLEALIRLQDPILGIVTPDAFIGVAERNDVILPLGAWVLRQALSDAAAWRLHTVPNVRIIVNVSARQIERGSFADEVFAALAEADLPANSLELEITERMLMRDVNQATCQLERLHAEGVHIAIDDFGVEHSCLSSLHHLPVDTLKIDRSFIRAVRENPEVMHIIEAIVSMARTLRKRVVAEGVETAEEIAALLQVGDMDLQGFYFSRPLPAEGIVANLSRWYVGMSMSRTSR